MPSRRQFRSSVRALLSIETLESRALLAGNVTASVSKGTLVIRGDAAANEIIISQLTTAGGYRITPVAGSGTTINSNANAVDLLNVVRFDIKMLGGDDQVGIGNDAALVGSMLDALADYPNEGDEQQASIVAQDGNNDPENPEILTFLGGDDDDGFDIENPEFTSQQLAQLPTRVTGMTTIDLGDGNDSLVYMIRSTSNIQVEGGKGDDAVLSMLTTISNMNINTDPRRGEGMGNDLAVVVMTKVRGDLAISTGAQDDAVVVLGTTVANMGIGTGGVLSGALTDDDVVFVANVSASDNLGIQTEGGNDGIYIDTINGDTFQIAAGTGDDEVDVVGAALLNLLIDTAAGEDWVSISTGEDGLAPVVIRRNLSINTGADDDTVELDGGMLGLFIGGNFDLRTGLGDDNVQLHQLAIGRVANIDTDTGADTVTLDGLDVRNDLIVNLGAGNDVLSVHNLGAARHTLKGGTGNDVLHNLGDHDFDLKHTQFESVDDGSV